MKKFKELFEKTLNFAQRRKQGIRMKVLAKSSGFQMKKKRSLMRIRDTAKIQVIARKKVIQGIRDKFYKDYNNMSIPQKVKIDQNINQKYGAKIAKLTTKLVKELKGKEAARVKAVKDSMGNSK
jgi:hypothetical protein